MDKPEQPKPKSYLELLVELTALRGAIDAVNRAMVPVRVHSAKKLAEKQNL